MPGAELAEALRGAVADERVLAAIAAVDRAAFVPAALQGRAWANEALPIGDGQTISQPLVVALMCDLLDLRPADRVLDVGTGSGYHAAVLARLAAEVWTVEVRTLPVTEVAGVHYVRGDGLAGLPGQAPFDAINVAAAGSEDQLEALLGQLAPGGRLVAPVGGRRGQVLARFERTGSGIGRTDHGKVRFVPLVG